MNRFRELFPATSRHGYFMASTLGAMPITVGPALQKMTEVWVEEGGNAWERWLALSADVANQCGSLIGAKPGTVAMQLNVSSIMATLLSSLDFSKKRNKIVYTDLDFPTLHYLSETWKDFGARTVRVPSRDGIGVDLQEFLDAIDEETLLVPTCHVFFGSSFKQDMAAICAKARKVGAMVTVDLYQSAGAMPIDVTEWGVDFAIGGSHKFLCGGSGAGYLYVRPDLVSGLKPKVTGWLSHPKAFDMRLEPMDWAEGMQRFTGGTVSVAPLYAAPCGYAIIEEAGPARIREHSISLTDRIFQWAEQLGFETRTPRNLDNRGPAVHVRFPGMEDSQARLKERGFLVHYREAYQGLRIAPHLYNTLDEVDRLMKSLEEISKGK